MPTSLRVPKRRNWRRSSVNMPDAPVFEKLTQALLERRTVFGSRAEVIAVYSGFEAGMIDSVSYIQLDEHLGRLTARDLRQLETSVPLETLKTVVDLAVEIGREAGKASRSGPCS